MSLKVALYIFGHDELTPHDLVMAGERANVFIIALDRWGGELE